MVDKVENPQPSDEPRMTFDYPRVKELLPGKHLELSSKVHDYLSNLCHACLFSADLKHSYLTIPVHPDDRHYFPFTISGIGQVHQHECSKAHSLRIFCTADKSMMRSDICKGCVGKGYCSSTITGRRINSCRSEYVASGISACNNYADAWSRYTPLTNTASRGELMNLAPPLSIPDPFGTGCIIFLALLVFEKHSLAKG